MAFRKILGIAAGAVVTTALMSSNSFAALGDFNFSTALTNGTPAGTQTVTPQVGATPGQISSSQSGNFFTFTNGFDNTDSGLGLGTAIVLTNYNSSGSSTTAGSVSANYTETITFTDTNIGQTLVQTLTGSYAGSISTTSATLLQTFNSNTLTFVFTDGTYTVSNISELSPGAPGSTNGAAGARVTFSNLGAAPEPSALMLLVPGGLGLIGLARRRKSN